MKNHILTVAFLMVILTSCFVESPKYTTLEKVTSLQLGMTKAQVENILGVQPYNLKAYTDSSKVFIYVYRVIDRKTLSFNTKPVNGRIKTGNYVQLYVAYSKDGKVVYVESCSVCPDNLVNKSKVDFEKVIAFITVTLPVLLLYVGLKL